jgi:hypothetical protein
VRLPQPRGHASTHVDYPLWRWFQAPSMRFTAFLPLRYHVVLCLGLVALCGRISQGLRRGMVYCHAWKRRLGFSRWGSVAAKHVGAMCARGTLMVGSGDAIAAGEREGSGGCGVMLRPTVRRPCVGFHRVGGGIYGVTTDRPHAGGT